MNRPKLFTVGTSLSWLLPVYDAATKQLVAPASTPNVRAILRDATTIDEAVTVSAIVTGLYRCSYTPGTVAHGSQFAIREEVMIGAETYPNYFQTTAVAADPATAAGQAAIQAVVNQLTDDEADTAAAIAASQVTVLAAIAGISGGGGGSATVANQEAILAKLVSQGAVILASLANPRHLELYHGDAYDDSGRVAITRDVGKSVDGLPCTLTIRRQSDDVAVFAVASNGVGNQVRVAFDSTAWTDNPLAIASVDKKDYKFDIEVQMSANQKWTPLFGDCTIHEDQTR